MIISPTRPPPLCPRAPTECDVDPIIAAALGSWTFPPWVVVGLPLTLAVYARGWRQLHRQMPNRFGGWRLAAFAAGLATIFVAIASPLDAFGGLLLQVHMTQHLLLMMVAPPLIWLGAPVAPLLRGLPRGVVKHGLGPFLAWPALYRFSHRLSHPVVCWLSFVVTTWAWHVPGLYELALRAPAWHQIEHICFLLTALLFWWPVVQPWPSTPIWPRWAIVPYLLLADIQNTLFSALFTFSERLLYPAYATVPGLWGVSALDDQATAGAIMWVPGSVAFLIPLGWVIVELAGCVNGGRTQPSAASLAPAPAAPVAALGSAACAGRWLRSSVAPSAARAAGQSCWSSRPPSSPTACSDRR